MKTLPIFAILITLLLGARAYAAGEPYIAPYLNDKKAAFSFTFDDGFKGQVANTLEIIDPLGIKGTFFVIPQRMDDQGSGSIQWDQAKALQANGHEIGTHGAVKPKLHEIPAQEMREKITGGAELITSNTGVRPVSYARPGGSKYTDEVLEEVRERHYFIRSAEHMPNMEQARYGNAGKRKWDDQKTRQKIEAAIEQGQWFVPTVHAIVAGYSPFDSKEAFKAHCEWLVSKEDVLWIAPMGEIGRYVFERDAAKLDVITTTANSLVFRLSTELEDKEVFNYPLTVVIPGVSAASVEAINEQREPVEATVAGDKILVNVIPNGEAYKVTW